MRIHDMTADQLRLLAMRCTDHNCIKLRKPHGTVTADSGDYFAYPARSEPMKRYWRAAKKDLLDRELRGGSYAGDVGHVVIGGKHFSFYPKSGMIVRDDFALWCEAHFDAYVRADGAAKESTRPLHQEDVTIDPGLKMWKQIREIALKMPASTGMYPDDAWHTEYDMRQSLNVLATSMAAFEKRGQFFPILRCDCDFLGAKISYRQRKYTEAKKFLMGLAASAMKAAMYIQENHSAKEGSEE